MTEPAAPPPLLGHVVRFSRVLHSAGLGVSSASVIQFCRSLELIDIGNRRDFYAAAMTSFITRREEMERFDQVFREYWEGLATDELARQSERASEDGADTGQNSSANSPTAERREAGAASRDEDPGEGESEVIGWSTEALLTQKDLGSMDSAELEQARAAMSRLARMLAGSPALRHRAAARGPRLDFRRMFRRNVPYDAQPMTLLFRQQRIRKTRLVLLCDVSGSMERYSRFLIQLMYGLRRVLPRMDIGVFATRLTMITEQLERFDAERSLTRLSEQVRDWGSGTDIGASLREFNREHAHRIAGNRTTLLILSDGWDRGDAALMRREIETLYRRVYRLVWLNPLLGGRDYLPLCRGIRTALPYMDDFLPAHNLESLCAVVRALRTRH